MRLALIAPDLDTPGGAESVAAWTAAGLHRRGHEVALYARALWPELWPDLPELASLLRPVPPAPPGTRRRQALATARALAAELSRWPLLYAHGELALHWAAGARAPLAWYCHEPPRRLYPRRTEAWTLRHPHADPAHPMRLWLEQTRRRGLRGRCKDWLERRHHQSCARRARALFVNSDYSAALAQDIYGRAPLRLDLGLPAPPESGTPQPASATPATASVVPAREIAVIAGGGPHKNLYGVLAVAALCAHRDWSFQVWGPGTDGPEFVRRVQDLGLAPRVRLHGCLPPAAAEERWRSAALLLFLPLSEPFGLAGVEALMRGIPVLASNHGGPAEWLRRCGGGWTADPLRPRQAASALDAMLDQLPVWRERAAQARLRARERFGLEAYLDRSEAALAAVLRSGG